MDCTLQTRWGERIAFQLHVNNATSIVRATKKPPIHNPIYKLYRINKKNCSLLRLFLEILYVFVYFFVVVVAYQFGRRQHCRVNTGCWLDTLCIIAPKITSIFQSPPPRDTKFTWVMHVHSVPQMVLKSSSFCADCTHYDRFVGARAHVVCTITRFVEFEAITECRMERARCVYFGCIYLYMYVRST